MTHAKTSTQLDCIDALFQVRDEPNVVWLAMGNTADIPASIPPAIREHVNGLGLRVHAIADALQRSIAVATPIKAA